MKLSSLQKGLVGHWTMSQDSLKGSLLADKTPYENDGTIYGATFTTDRKGKANSAMSFDGVDDYIDIENTLLNGLTKFTFSIWFKGNGFRGLFSFAKTIRDTWRLTPHTETTIRFRDNSGNTYDSVILGMTTDWNHFVAVYDASINKITYYMNNIAVASANPTGTAMYTDIDSFTIGKILDASYQPFKGSIDDVRIYNRALSEPEIKTLYNSYNPNIKMKTSLPKIKLYGGDKEIKENGFIRVDKNVNNAIYFEDPESNLYGKQYFYVMKYQARNNGGVPTSTGSDLPWVNINQINAKAVSEAAGYHLITNWEWMAIARDIEQVPENWTGGAVGSGMIKRGNVGTTDDGSYNGADPETGILNDKAKLKLSNGEEIYHFSGNVWEWVDEKIECGVASCPISMMPYDSTPASEWVEFTNINTWGKYTKAELGPLGNYNSANGVGEIYTSADESYSGNSPYDNTVHACRRGGDWGRSLGAGVFAVHFNNAPEYTNTYVGFRCAR